MTTTIPTPNLRTCLVAVLLAISSLLALWGGTAHAADDYLEPDKAFQFSAEMVNPHLISVTYLIADGYYMYRDKFRFQVAPAASKLGKIRFPAGSVKQDPLFGKVETYRHAVRIQLALLSLPADGKVVLTAISQGCADVGVCYTPMTSQIVLGAHGAQDHEPGKPMSSLLMH